MTENRPPEDDLTEEFRTLGKNLVEALRAAWESPERKRLQTELETGINELGNTLRREVSSVRENPAAQRLRENVQDVGQRVRSGEAQARVRGELISALRTVNEELRKATERMEQHETGGQASAASGASEVKTEVHPDDAASGSVAAPDQGTGHVENSPDDADAGSPTHLS